MDPEGETAKWGAENSDGERKNESRQKRIGGGTSGHLPNIRIEQKIKANEQGKRGIVPSGRTEQTRVEKMEENLKLFGKLQVIKSRI